MLPKLYKVAKIGSGFLAIMARPHADDQSAEGFFGLAEAGIKRIISVLEVHEEYVLGLENEAQYCADADIDFSSFPIPDRGVPASADDLAELSRKVYLDCADGESTAIHCRAGIGRSSLVAAAVLLHAGMTIDDSLLLIQKARGFAVPDTPEQAQWLRDNSRILLETGMSNKALH